MKFYNIQIVRYARFAKQIECMGIYFLLFTGLIVLSIATRGINLMAFHLVLAFSGWLTWTFMEYMHHRFWSHGPRKSHKHNHWDNHLHHHQHPTEIRITFPQRIMILGACVISFTAAIWLNNYFTLFAGLIFGFSWYTFMHYVLHQRWAAKVFPRLQRYHIFHHCKYPNHCHGVSVYWWDLAFGTRPPKKMEISQRIEEFYYGKK